MTSLCDPDVTGLLGVKGEAGYNFRFNKVYRVFFTKHMSAVQGDKLQMSQMMTSIWIL